LWHFQFVCIPFAGGHYQPLLLNVSLLLVLTTDYSDWLMQATEVDNDEVFGVFDDYVMTKYEKFQNSRWLIDWINLLILCDNWNQVVKIKEMNNCRLFTEFLLKFLTVLILLIVINSLTRLQPNKHWMTSVWRHFDVVKTVRDIIRISCFVTIMKLPHELQIYSTVFVKKCMCILHFSR